MPLRFNRFPPLPPTPPVATRWPNLGWLGAGNLSVMKMYNLLPEAIRDEETESELRALPLRPYAQYLVGQANLSLPWDPPYSLWSAYTLSSTPPRADGKDGLPPHMCLRIGGRRDDLALAGRCLPVEPSPALPIAEPLYIWYGGRREVAVADFPGAYHESNVSKFTAEDEAPIQTALDSLRSGPALTPPSLACQSLPPTILGYDTQTLLRVQQHIFAIDDRNRGLSSATRMSDFIRLAQPYTIRPLFDLSFNPDAFQNRMFGSPLDLHEDMRGFYLVVFKAIAKYLMRHDIPSDALMGSYGEGMGDLSQHEQSRQKGRKRGGRSRKRAGV